MKTENNPYKIKNEIRQTVYQWMSINNNNDVNHIILKQVILYCSFYIAQL